MVVRLKYNHPLLFLEVTVDLERKLVVADCMTCSCCQTVFEDRDEQVNIKLS